MEKVLYEEPDEEDSISPELLEAIEKYGSKTVYAKTEAALQRKFEIERGYSNPEDWVHTVEHGWFYKPWDNQVDYENINSIPYNELTPEQQLQRDYETDRYVNMTLYGN